MKRFHVHVAVDNLTDAIGFDSALFAAKPSVVKPAASAACRCANKPPRC
jgi:hypothetical protein